MEDSARSAGDRRRKPSDDRRVDEVGEESFPASDPPASWAGEDPRDRLDDPRRARPTAD